ncbi:MAG TPA: hypothetical protein VHK90_00650 [Thermoanaerobaculia bacterium]|nr:hypothetical protein [Thermoanaerobaculia bacterium]
MNPLIPLSERRPQQVEKGLSRESRAAFQQRPITEWEKVAHDLQPRVNEVRAKMAARRRAPAPPPGLLNRKAETLTLTSQMLTSRPVPGVPQTNVDADGDKVPDTLEDALWHAWVPLYFLSEGERNNFVFFQDNPTQKIIERTQPTPPVGYFSVLKLFTAPLGGVQHGFLQINFATFWDQDDGPAIAGNCRALARVLQILTTIPIVQVIELLFNHQWDEEHSAALVAAPLVGDAYNRDPAAYRLYNFYTAAHENKVNDRSFYLFPRRPVAPGQHMKLALSLKKHATYPGNPEGLPLVPDEYMDAVFEIIGLLYQLQYISIHLYLGLLHLASIVFYDCIVERFRQRDNGVTPSPMINVGEHERPINRSSWIRNDPFPRKLAALWDVNVVRRLPVPDVGGGPGDGPDIDPPDRDPRDPRDRDPRPRER